MRSRGPSSPGCWPGQDDDDVIKLGADIEVTSMRPEQDGSDHDYPGQVADTGCQLRLREPEEESLTITGQCQHRRRNQTQDSLETNQGLIRVDLFIT